MAKFRVPLGNIVLIFVLWNIIQLIVLALRPPTFYQNKIFCTGKQWVAFIIILLVSGSIGMQFDFRIIWLYFCNGTKSILIFRPKLFVYFVTSLFSYLFISLSSLPLHNLSICALLSHLSFNKQELTKINFIWNVLKSQTFKGTKEK